MKKIIFCILFYSSLFATETNHQFQVIKEKTYADQSSGVGTLSNYQISPLSQIMTKDQFNNLNHNNLPNYFSKNPSSQRGLAYRKKVRANILTIDTRDQKACTAIQDKLSTHYPQNDYQDLCVQDEEKPFTSVVITSPETTEYRTYLNKNFINIDPKYGELAKQTRNLAGLGLLTIGFIYALPEDVSNWDRSDFKNLGKNWSKNVKEGPVVDKDDWFLNYIGHPISGAAYHLVARNAGLGAWQSFGYSVFMSTFFWEYGLEAFAETPSIQDLILTPVIGSLLGEVFYQSISKIDANDGKLWGSKRMGRIAKNVMNPAEPMLRWVNDKVFDKEVIKSAKTYFYMKDPGTREINNPEFVSSSSEVGIGIELKF